MIGGVKYTVSLPSLPYRVQTHVVPMAQERCQALSEHLTLIYTGEAHLMADISVSAALRAWSRQPQRTACFVPRLAAWPRAARDTLLLLMLVLVLTHVCALPYRTAC